MNPVIVPIVCAIILMYCGVLASKIIETGIYLFKHYRDLDKYPRLNREVLGRCEQTEGEIHKWHKAKLALSGITPGEYLICEKCGAISGVNELRVNKAGLEVLINNARIEREKVEIERKSIDRMKEILTADREMWIKTFSKEFGRDSAKNEELLRQFSKFTVESTTAAGDQIIREFKGKF